MMDARVSAQIAQADSKDPAVIMEAMSVGLGQALMLPGFIAVAAVLVVAFLSDGQKARR